MDYRKPDFLLLVTDQTAHFIWCDGCSAQHEVDIRVKTSRAEFSFMKDKCWLPHFTCNQIILNMNMSLFRKRVHVCTFDISHDKLVSLLVLWCWLLAEFHTRRGSFLGDEILEFIVQFTCHWPVPPPTVHLFVAFYMTACQPALFQSGPATHISSKPLPSPTSTSLLFA